MCSEWFSKDALYVMDVLGRVGVSTLMLALSNDKIFFLPCVHRSCRS